MTPFTMQRSFTFVPVTLREMHESLPKIDKVTLTYSSRTRKPNPYKNDAAARIFPQLNNTKIWIPCHEA